MLRTSYICINLLKIKALQVQYYIEIEGLFELHETLQIETFNASTVITQLNYHL
jgi:hypothetical protein